MTPSNCFDCWSATTGIAPTFRSHIIRATDWAESVGKQHTGFSLITSLIFTVISNPAPSYLLGLNFDLVDDLHAAGSLRCRGNGLLVLVFAAHRAGQRYRSTAHAGIQLGRR